MRILALDIGTRKTGMAFAVYPPGILLSLPTFHHVSSSVLLCEVARLIQERNISHVVVGLPLLSSGKEGEQARRVRGVLSSMRHFGVQVSLLDERYTSTHHPSQDPDAVAACSILTVFMDRLDSKQV